LPTKAACRAAAAGDARSSPPEWARHFEPGTALVGAFTIVGRWPAIIVGVLALREIARRTAGSTVPNCQGGIITGLFASLLTLGAFLSPTVLGVDHFLRLLQFATKIEYPQNTDKIEGIDDVEIIRRPMAGPSSPGKVSRRMTSSPPS